MDGLTPGANNLQVSVTDAVGNTDNSMIYPVYLDNLDPSIVIGDGNGNHSAALFSSGNGVTYAGDLQTVNNVDPLYFETNKSEFNSSADPTNLDNNGIPYFRFTVSDERAPSDLADSQTIKVEMQYQTSDASSQIQTIDDWHVLNRYQNCGTQSTSCEYYIPLAYPFLHENWDQTTSEKEHIINVRVTDQANNQKDTTFSFYADFYVPPIKTCPSGQQCTQGELVVNDLDPFSGADKFKNRDTVLYNATLDTTIYNFTNPSNKSMYIKLAEPNSTAHSVIQAIEQEQRYQLVNKATAIQWRGAIIDTSTPCPTVTLNGTDPAWISVTKVLNNYNGVAWEWRRPSDTVIGDTQFKADRDDLTTLQQNSDWVNVEHFDDQFGILLNFKEDYKLSSTAASDYLFISDTSATCPEQRYFQQQEVYTYKSLDGPRDVVTSLQPVSAEFNTNGYIVTANGVDVAANTEGWYLIPANANVVVTKEVSTNTTPDLVFHEADFSLTASYTDPSVRDSSLTWSIDRNLNITTIHNTGEANIGVMSQRETLSGTGVKEYVTSRQ